MVFLCTKEVQGVKYIWSTWTKAKIFTVYYWEWTILYCALFWLFFDNLMRNDWEMTKKWLRNDWEMTEKWLINDW